KTAPSPFPVVYAVTPNQKQASFEWKDIAFDGSAAYYVRVTQRADPVLVNKKSFGAAVSFPNEMAWSSPVWVDREHWGGRMRFTMLVLLTASAMAQKLGQKDFRVSLSVSPFVEMAFSNGVEFTDGKLTAKTTEELQRLFMAHGANEVYARIGTNRKYSR